jgi:hypothetical protein
MVTQLQWPLQQIVEIQWLPLTKVGFLRVVLSPSLKCRCRRHRHPLRWQQRWHCHHRRHRCHHCRCLRHCRCRGHHQRCFNNVASSSLYRRALWWPIGGAGPNHSSPNCPHWLIVVLDGWRSTCKRSACRCHPSPSHHRRPIVVVKSPLSNRRPQIAAVVVIDIVAVGSGGGIISIAVTVAVTISPITIVAVILDVALLMSLRHRCRNGGEASFLGSYPTYSYVGYSARPLVVCGNEGFW